MANPVSRWWGRRTNPTATSPDDSPPSGPVAAASPTRPLLRWRGRRSRGTDVKPNASGSGPPPSAESPPVAPTNPPPSVSKAPARSAMKKSAGAQDPGNKPGRGRVRFGEDTETIIDVVSDSHEESSESRLDFVPSMMDVLAKLSVTYPFVKAVFLPFKFAYEQQLTNDRKSKHLFEEMAKGVRALIYVDELDLEQPTGASIKNLTEISEKMAMNIAACCNVLDVYQKLQPLQKFLTAGTWNELFAERAIQFEVQQQELRAALNLSVAIPRGKTMIVAEFDSCKPPHAADFDMWIAEVGGREKLISDETSTSWEKLLVYQTPLLSAGLSGNPRVGEPRVKEFRKEYELISRDVVSLIQDNQKSLAHRLETLVDAVDQDVTTEIARSRDSINDMDRYTAPTASRPPIMSRTPSSASIKKAMGAPGLESKSRRGSIHVWDHTDPVSDAVTNSTLQDFGDALLDLIPPLMDGLTSLSKIHPFLTDSVLKDEDKCKELLAYQTSLIGTHSLELTGPQAAGKRGESPFTGKTLHDEYLLITQAKDLNSLLAQNMNVLELSIDALNQDLTAKVEGSADRVVDRVVDAFHRGPHERLQNQDKQIMVEVWKNQGWRGSTKTWKLVLALRDHLIELAEMEKSGDGRNTPAPLAHRDTVSTTVPGDTAAEEEKLLSLEDMWAIECLQVRRLRNLNQVLDPDASGFSTIAEVNTFTQSCPPKWRLPHWIAYWVVGWQASATAYCAEIDNLIAQMVLIRDRVRVKMPASMIIWTKFQDYVDSQEETLRTRLEKIHYVIDSSSTVVEALIPGDHIERTILTLIALLMRRHLAKMHLCLTKDISENELFDDSLAIRVVVDVAWDRYSHLLDYFGWKSPLNREHYRNTVVQSPSPEIQEFEPDELEGILVYDANGSKLPIPQQGMDGPDTSQSFNGQLSDVPQSDKHLESRERGLPPLIEVPESPPTMSHDTQMDNIDGLWFGFHSDDTDPPYNGMFEVCITTSATDAQVVILGSGAAKSLEWTTTGQITGGDHRVHFQRRFSDGYVQCYDGVFDPVCRIISGTYSCENDDLEDSSRFFLKPGVMRNPSRSLLVFALDTVVGHFRRKASFARALEHMKRVQLYVQLSVESSGAGSILRAFRMWETLDEVDWEPEVRREVDMLASWYQRAEESHGFLQCDACHKSILRSRILCLECEPKEFEQSVDLDAQDACISASMLIGRSDVMHTPTHLLLKVRDRLLLRDHAGTKQAAIHCSKLATRNYETTDNGFTRCLICRERASTPCWYCLDCEAVDAFVCEACEKEIDNLAPWKYQRRYRTELANSTPHNILHRLIRFGVKLEMVPKPDTERMASIEHLRLLESRMTELLNERHKEMTSRVDEVDRRLGRMESLLQGLRQSSNASL
ncbi:hypothetical protein B0H16DRAFT_1892397 [Mycena metata]|uniref:ZZ-type domain-containing protein n=1 Tax=Mycena metata TaxID=1033252 RepID=A0AAD7I4E6_9AGAR|nr:hypothetical protein B0H16DRAFT_1892397 [Mycena metata]